MKLAGTNVLVTGGAGFIGSHLVEELLRAGAKVGVIDDLSTGRMSNLPAGVRLRSGDIADFEFVKAVVGEYDSVLHEAARVSVTRSIEDPETTNRVNTKGTLNLLAASKDAAVERFVYASSSSVYGDTPILPKEETMPPNPVSPYAVSKLAGENYCKAFATVYGLKTVSLRYFNVYGPRQTAGPYSGVIPAFIERAFAGEPPVIFGDGTQTRDFTYVKDVVQANLLSLEKPVKGGEVFNVGSHSRTSLNELAKLVCRLTGREGLAPIYQSLRIGDIMHSYADISRISDSLGYKPVYSIEKGLAEVVEWFKGAR